MKFSLVLTKPLVYKLMTSALLQSHQLFLLHFLSQCKEVFMLTSLALIFLSGLLLASVFEKLKLPRIIGMLLAGILLGPYVLNLLDDSVLSVSSDLRQMALIIILIKAGLSLNLSDLKKVGRPAILMSFLPATFEIIGYVLLAPALLGISRIEAAVMGAVLAAVSPAVVIPRMVQLMETNYGTEKSIPQLIMAGASCDDIFVIVLSVAVLAILITAPLGAIGIDRTYKKLLVREK